MSFNIGLMISDKVKNCDKKTYLFFFIMSVILITAVILRIISYLDVKPLWHDEAPIALTVIKNGFLSMFDNIEANQKAPFFFWIFTKFTGQFGNYNELSLRVFPFVCSVLSVFCFYVFSRRILNNKIAVIIANFIFAVDYRLLYFSSELKQYAGDVLFFMLAVLVFDNMSKKLFSAKTAFLYVIFSIILVLNSFPACFVIIGFILYKVFRLKKEEKDSFLVANIILFLASFAYFVRFLLDKYITEMNYQTEYWASGFINFQDNINTFIDLFGYLFYPMLFTIIGIVFFVYGTVVILKEKQNINYIILLSLLAVIIASLLKIYPLYNRTCLYLIPVILVIMLKPLDLTKTEHISSIQKIYIISLIVTLVFSFRYMYHMRYDKKIIGTNIYAEWNAKDTLKYIQNNYENGNVIFIDKPSKLQFEYYKRYFNFYPENVIEHNYMDETEEHFLDFINSELKPNNTYYFYCIHTWNRDKNKSKYLFKWKENNKEYIKDVFKAKRSFVLKVKT